jgi:hypothetical protein
LNWFLEGTRKLLQDIAQHGDIALSQRQNDYITQSETAAETKRVEFEVVRPPHQPRRNPRGQTRRLTLRVFVSICHLVEQGWAITKACESQSVTYSLFRLRCSENPRLEQRIKEAEAVRFQRRQEEAVESVMRAGEKSWMAHAWFLERSMFTVVGRAALPVTLREVFHGSSAE